MIAHGFTKAYIFCVWLLSFVLSLIALALGHDLFMMFIVNTLETEEYAARFLNVVCYSVAGLLCIAFYTLIYDFLNRYAKKRLLLSGSLFIIGAQLMSIGLLQFALTLYNYLPSDWLNIGLVTMEGLLGTMMLFLALRKKGPPT